MSTNGGLKRLLILDDDADFRKLILVYLKKMFEGVELVEYDPVAQGVPGEDFDWSQYDVLLLDYYLCIHGVTGLDILQANRKNKFFPATIMLTGAGNEEVAVRAIKAGVYEYLRKEKLDKEELRNSILDAFEKHKVERERLSELTNQSHAFNKALFYQQLERTEEEKEQRVLLLLELDNHEVLEERLGIILRDNIIRHIAKQSFEIFQLGDCDPSITRFSDVSVALLINDPDSEDTLSFNLQGLCKHLEKRPYKFEEKKFRFTVSIGVLPLTNKRGSAEAIIQTVRNACDIAGQTEGNSFHIHTASDLVTTASTVAPVTAGKTTSETAVQPEPSNQEPTPTIATPEIEEESSQDVTTPDAVETVDASESDTTEASEPEQTEELQLSSESATVTGPEVEQEKNDVTIPGTVEAVETPKPPAGESSEPEETAEPESPSEPAPAASTPDTTVEIVVEPTAVEEAEPRETAEPEPPTELAPAVTAPEDTGEIEAEPIADEEAEPEETTAPEPSTEPEPRETAEPEPPPELAPAVTAPEDTGEIAAEPIADEEAAAEERTQPGSVQIPNSIQAKPDIAAESDVEEIADTAEPDTLQESKPEVLEQKQVVTAALAPTPIKPQEKKAKAPEKDAAELIESELDEEALKIKKAFDEKRVIQTFQPVISLSDTGEEEEQEVHNISLQLLDTDGKIIDADEIYTHTNTPAFRKYIDRWMIREAIGRVVNSDANYVFVIKLSQESLADATLFNWLRKLLAGLDASSPGKSIALEITTPDFSSREKQAGALIGYLTKSHGFRFTLSQFSKPGEVNALTGKAKFSLVRINHELLKELATTYDEESKTSKLQDLKALGVNIIADNVEDATTLTEVIGVGVDYAIGNFIGEPTQQLDEVTNVESFEIV